MLEYLYIWWNILYNINNNIMYLETISHIFINIITGVSIIKGIGYLKGLKEKTNSATFNFWSQLRARLGEILSWLEDDYSLLDNMYEPVARNAWQSELASREERVKDFKKIVEETINYIKSTPDQMPAYKGWTNDYIFLIAFLNDVIKYDVTNANRYFKYRGQISKPERDNICKNICVVLERLCIGITDKQIRIENQIL